MTGVKFGFSDQVIVPLVQASGMPKTDDWQLLKPDIDTCRRY